MARGGRVTGGFVTPHTSRNNDCDHCFCFARGGPRPPELTLAFSPVLGSIWVFFLCLFATIQRRLGPPRLGIFLFSALRVLHFFSPCWFGAADWCWLFGKVLSDLGLLVEKFCGIKLSPLTRCVVGLSPCLL